MSINLFTACDSDNLKEDVNSNTNTVSIVNSSNTDSSITVSVDLSSSNHNTSSNSQSKAPAELISVVGDSAYLYKFDENTYKLDMPPITSIFFVKNGEKIYIIDACKATEDIEKFVVPAAKKLNIDLNKVGGILITHTHWDHVDGLPALLTACPNAHVYGYNSSNKYANSLVYTSVGEGFVIDELFKVITIFGHSNDSIGFIDNRTKTLFSGDAIQLYGVSTSGMYIFDGVDKYMTSLEKLRGVEINNILASHPYVPNGAFAVGKEQSIKHIDDSIEYMIELVQFTSEQYMLGVTEPAEIRKKFIDIKSKEVKEFPTAGFDSAIKSIIDVYF